MIAKQISKVAVALILAAGAAVFGPTGCSPSSSSVCNKVCDCVGCSDKERDDCIDDFDDARKTAEDEGCGDQYSEYFSCADSELSCNDSELDADGCDTEAEELGKCLGGVSVPIGGGNQCEVAFARVNAKLEECGMDPLESTAGDECAPENGAILDCAAGCYEDASCGELTGEDPIDDFYDCLSFCQ